VILCGSIIAPLLLLNGLNQTTAINSSLLLNAETMFTVAIAFVFLNERCNRREYVGILLLVVGVIFVTTSGAFQDVAFSEYLLGNLLIIGACFFWGIDNNLSKFLSNKRDIIMVTGLKCFIGGAALLAMAFLLGFSFSIPLASIPYILLAGAFSIAFSVLFFLFALRKIGSMRTGVIFSLSSLFGAVLAFAVLGEAFTIIELIAGLIMILGIYVLYRCGEIKKS
jgi:drug/metabolite transporter (DMT)-like permease